MAQGVALPVVSTQQSPQTGLRQRAHGPAASAPHESQGTKPPSSPWDINDPLTPTSLAERLACH